MNKEKLSEHVTNILKRASSPGLHICDLATGGGKSYAIGKLTCEYYPKYFDRVIIFCVKKDLVTAMDNDIKRHIDNKSSLLKTRNKLVLKSNIDSLHEAMETQDVDNLINEFEQVANKEKDKRGHKTYFSIIKNMKNKLERFKSISDDIAKNLEKYNGDNEEGFRREIKKFITNYKKMNKGVKNSSVYDFFMNKCPSLKKVYPQTLFLSPETKVVLMTIHKSMYGVDTIFAGTRSLPRSMDFKKCLIIFDESDQCALSMRTCIFEIALKNLNMSTYARSIYKLYFYYVGLLYKNIQLTDKEAAKLQTKVYDEGKNLIDKIWKEKVGKRVDFPDIYTSTPEEIDEFVKGIFFSGININVLVQPKGMKAKSYIYNKKGKKYISLNVTGDNPISNQDCNFQTDEKTFVSILLRSIKVIQNRLCKIIVASFNRRVKLFEADLKNKAQNKDIKKEKMNLPRIEDEIHTFVERLHVIDSAFLEKQLLEYITNRKNFKKKDKKILDGSVYAQGFYYFENVMDERDYDHGIHISYKQISTTPEKILVDLLNEELGNSIILCSATANNKSVMANFDFKYIKICLTQRIDYLSEDESSTFDSLVTATYPTGHQILTKPIKEYVYKSDLTKNLFEIPDYYRKMFCSEALANGLVDNILYNMIKKMDAAYKNDDKKIKYELQRMWRFVECYWNFYYNDDIHTMIFFQNPLGTKVSDIYNMLACLVDGSYKCPQTNGEPSLFLMPEDWKNDTLLFENNFDNIQSEIKQRFKHEPDAKIMLITAYNSFKAGTNLQYVIPKGIKVLYGEDWDGEEIAKKKDWDAIYVDLPTCYLSMEENSNVSFYNILLSLSMFEYNGYITQGEVANWISRARNNSFYFSERSCPSILPDKIAWIQTILEQAVGRIARTKNKSPRTFIFYDERICPYATSFRTNKSLSPEFRELVSALQTRDDHSDLQLQAIEEIIQKNNKEKSLRLLADNRAKALKYTPKPGNGYDFWEENKEEEIPDFITQAQNINESFKRTIIRHPIIKSIDELMDEDILFKEMDLCYGKYDVNVLLNSPCKRKFDILMKNDIIRDFFVSNGFDAEWEEQGLTLHPEILNSEYTGEIGEQAFKALVLHYTGWKDSKLLRLTGKLYEYADFVTQIRKGKFGIAIDVKNRHPKDIILDNPFDLASSKKIRIKEKRLDCNLLLVNMLKIDRNPIDATQILGLIDDHGQLIGKNMDLLLKFLNAE